jgi:predicted DNA-binding transcriptional regulator AlpA
MNDELVSIRRLAQVLDCSPKTVRDWMYKNRRAPTSDPLPYYRVGGLVRFRLNDVTAWIDRRRVRISPLSMVATPPRIREKPVRSQP